MGVLMKQGVNYSGFGAKNIAVAHYDSIGIPQVFFSDKAGNKINGAPSGQSRYLTTITSDPIAFFKWDHASLGYYSFGYGAISLRPLENGVDYSTYDVHSSLSLQETFVINGVTVYVYMEIDTWHENGMYVTINDTYNITTNYATDDDITATSKFMKDIVATLTDGYILPPEPLVRYSTVEHVVGTWIDNKPIYEKVIQWHGVGGSGTITTKELGAPAESIISLNILCTYPAGTNNTYYFDGPWWASGNKPIVRYSMHNYNSTWYVQVDVAESGAQDCDFIAIVRYTKTTD